ncbi:hypothetical protein C8R46DRAFT_1350984 [Mycena filopes]|nr:hypothetical protein C8R46DRAFT_1196239 [Mycena filopes]KAJ7166680.1 hypothetical protein C8R46DRAFT_1350984 [Mycena filopes]
MGATDTGFGTGLMGTWFTSILFGLSFAQAFHYFNNAEGDTRFRKGLVVVVMLFNICALGAEYAVMYLPTVTFWGDIESLSKETYAAPIAAICNGTIAFIVNAYLISRFYSVSKNIVIALLLHLMNLFAYVMSFIPPLIGAGPGHEKTLSDLKIIVPLSTVWAVASAVTDVLIAIALVWTLRGMKTNFKDTDRLLRRIMVISVQNGCTTSLASIGGMISTLLIPFSTVSSLFFFMLGPLYLLTLLSNLNLRGSSGKSGSRTWSSSRNHTGVPGNTSIIVNGIRVERTAITTVDPTTSEIEMEPRKGDDDPFKTHAIESA